MVHGVHAQGLVVAQQEGADVEGGAVGVGNPVRIQLDQRLDDLDEVLLGKLGQTEALGGIDHAAGVLLGAEQLDAAVRSAIGLQTLEDLGAVVQAGGRRMDGEVREGNDARVMPALVGAPVDQRHVVAEDFAKAQLRFVGGFRLGCGGFFNADVQHCFFLRSLSGII